MAGWAGEGGGRFGERREYEAPTLPSTPRQHGAARHNNSPPRNRNAQPHSWHTATKASREDDHKTQNGRPSTVQVKPLPVSGQNPDCTAMGH